MGQLLRRSGNKSRPARAQFCHCTQLHLTILYFPAAAACGPEFTPRGACGRPAELRRIKAALRSKVTHRRAFLARQSLVTMRSAVAILAVLSLSFGWLLGQFYKVLV